MKEVKSEPIPGTGACLPHWGPRLTLGPGTRITTAGDGNGPAEEATDVDADICQGQGHTPPAFHLPTAPPGESGEAGEERNEARSFCHRKTTLNFSSPCGGSAKSKKTPCRIREMNTHRRRVQGLQASQEALEGLPSKTFQGLTQSIPSHSSSPLTPPNPESMTTPESSKKLAHPSKRVGGSIEDGKDKEPKAHNLALQGAQAWCPARTYSFPSNSNSSVPNHLPTAGS